MALDLDELKAQFDRDGFAIVRGLLSNALLTEARAKMSSAIQRSGLEKSEDKAAVPAPDSRFRFANVNKGLERIDPYFQAFLETGPHIEILTHLLGETPTPATASYFSKDEPNEVIPPHRDGDNGATVWIALDPCGPENGCLFFLRGSHRDSDQSMWNLGEANELINHPEAVPARLEPGDASIHFSTTIHWSGKSLSGAPRRGLNAFYQRINRKRLKQPENAR